MCSCAYIWTYSTIPRHVRQHTCAHTQCCQTKTGSPFSPEDESVSFLATKGPAPPDHSNWRSSLMWSAAYQLLIAMHNCTTSDHRSCCCMEKIIKSDQRSRLTTFYKYHTQVFFFWLCTYARLQWPNLIWSPWSVFKYWCQGRRRRRQSLCTMCKENRGSIGIE